MAYTHDDVMTFSSLLDSPHKGPITQRFDILFDVYLKNRSTNRQVAVDLRFHDAHMKSL